MDKRPVAVVTGGTGGLGSAMCDRLIEAGWRVASLDLRSPSGRAPDSDTFIFVSCDITDPQSRQAAVGVVTERFGRVDCLVNNAGTIAPRPSHEAADHEWASIFAVHVEAAVSLTRLCLPWLLASEQASIVFVSSVGAARGMPGRLAYNAAKASLESVTRTLASEWGRAGLRVNAVAPGFVATAQALAMYEAGRADGEQRASRTSLGRLGQPREVANGVLWLASTESSYVTGQTITIDGGYVTDGRTGPDSTQLEPESLRNAVLSRGLG